jgi:hypothetical protein
MRAVRSLERFALFPEEHSEGLLPDESIVRLKLSQLRLERLRQCGGVGWLCNFGASWELDAFWAERLPASRKGIRRDAVLSILVGLPTAFARQRVAAASGVVWAQRLAGSLGHG